MALPVSHPIDEVVLSGSAVDCSSGKAGVIRAPFKGRVLEIGTMLGSVLSTADATCTTSIAGTAITGGAIVQTQSSSAIGDLDFAAVSGVGNNGTTANATITAANSFNEGDLIKFLQSGSGTAGGPLYCYVVVKRT